MTMEMSTLVHPQKTIKTQATRTTRQIEQHIEDDLRRVQKSISSNLNIDLRENIPFNEPT